MYREWHWDNYRLHHTAYPKYSLRVRDTIKQSEEDDLVNFECVNGLILTELVIIDSIDITNHRTLFNLFHEAEKAASLLVNREVNEKSV